MELYLFLKSPGPSSAVGLTSMLLLSRSTYNVVVPPGEGAGEPATGQERVRVGWMRVHFDV